MPWGIKLFIKNVPLCSPNLIVPILKLVKVDWVRRAWVDIKEMSMELKKKMSWHSYFFYCGK